MTVQPNPNFSRCMRQFNLRVLMIWQFFSRQMQSFDTVRCVDIVCFSSNWPLRSAFALTAAPLGCRSYSCGHYKVQAHSIPHWFSSVWHFFFCTCKTHWVYILSYCVCADYKWNTSPMDVLTFVSSSSVSSYSFIGWPATPSWRRAPWERRSNEGEEGSRWPLLVLFRWASIYASQWPPLSQSEREYVWNTDLVKNKNVETAAISPTAPAG